MGADGWLLSPAKLADGSAIDLLTGAAPSEEPRYADPLYSRWAKVTERVVDGKTQFTARSTGGCIADCAICTCNPANRQLRP